MFVHVVVMLCCVVVCVARVMSMCACSRGWDAWTHPHDGRTYVLPSRRLIVATYGALCHTCCIFPHVCCISPSHMLHLFLTLVSFSHFMHVAFSPSAYCSLPHACCVFSVTHIAMSPSRMFFFSFSMVVFLLHTCLFFSYTV